MLESVNVDSPDTGEGEDSDRIDALLSSALADQARERRMLVETVFGAKTALVKAEEELSGLRELIDKRDEALIDVIAKNNESLSQALSDNLLDAVGAIVAKLESAQAKSAAEGLIPRIEAIEEAILQLAQRVAELGDLPGQLRRDLEVSAVAIGDRIGEESASLLADMREDQVEVVQTLVAMSENELKELKQAVNSAKQEAMERTSTVGRDTVEAGRSTVEQMVEHLTGYLQARDEQLYRARDQRLIELFQQLSDTIGRGNKRKIGKAMEESAPPKPLTPAQPPVKAPPPMSTSRSFRPPPQGRTPEPPPTQSREFRDIQPAPGRPDPAFAFDPPVRRFDPEDLPAPFGTRPAGSIGPGKPVVEPDPAPTQAMANPLTRDELVRDYLIDSPEEMFADNPPAARAPRSRRGASGDKAAPAKPKSEGSSGRSPKPPAAPRSRRKS